MAVSGGRRAVWALLAASCGGAGDPGECRLAGYTSDDDGDGRAEVVIAYGYPGGDVVTEEADTNGDGVADWRSTRQHDGDGNPMAQRVDLDADGHDDAAWTWGWDAAGNMLWLEYDFGMDGSPEHRDDREWSAAGLPVRSATDFDGDGEPESVTLYDARGRVLHQTRHHDGVLEFEDRWTYDDAALTSVTETDLGGDGDLDAVRLYTYDELGRAVEMISDMQADGDVDGVTRVTWDDAAFQVRSEHAPDLDSPPDTVSVTWNDAAGEMLSYVVWTGGVSTTWGHTLRLDGRVLEQSSTLGAATTRRTWHWECGEGPDPASQ